ncbi:MAG TPA: DNA repair protein RecO [Polyangiales bacterium]
MRARSEHADALVVRSVDYGEADRIVTLLTPTLGKVSVLARGARRSKRRFAGTLEPFTLLDVEVSFGHGELGSLWGAQVKQAFPAILRDLPRLAVAGCALELVRELLAPRAPDATIFETTVHLLHALEAEQAEPMAALLAYQARVLALAGFAPQLSACGLCGKQPAAGRSAGFDPARGFLVCQSCGGARVRAAAALRVRLQQALGPQWLHAALAAWSEPELRVGEELLASFIEHRIDRPIGKSALLQSARRPGPASTS